MHAEMSPRTLNTSKPHRVYFLGPLEQLTSCFCGFSVVDVKVTRVSVSMSERFGEQDRSDNGSFTSSMDVSHESLCVC